MPLSECPVAMPMPDVVAEEPRSHRRSRGQIIPLFALSIFLFMGMCAIVIDITWYWSNSLRVQRAADAAALAGAVMLPDNPSAAFARARAEAVKNGYTDGVGGVVIAPSVDPNDNRRLFVTITAPVGTFFMRVVGVPSINASRTAHGEYVLPVPMGSPENYYGVFGPVRGATFTGRATVGFGGPNAVVAGGTWTNPTNVDGKTVQNNLTFATSPAYSSAANSTQQWTTFNLTSGTPAPPGTQIPTPSGTTTVTIKGLEVKVYAKASVTPTTCKFQVSTTYSGGTSTWVDSTAFTAPATTEQLFSFGSATDTTAWGAHAWVQSDFSNTNFKVGVRWKTGVAGCTAATTTLADWIAVRVSYETKTVTTLTTETPRSGHDLKAPGSACSTQSAGAPADCFLADGAALNPARGFWAEMNTEGAENVNGDAYQPYYDTATSHASTTCASGVTTACYDATNYYNYAVEMQPGSGNGYLYVFDPQYCSEAMAQGVGDYWFSGTNGVSSWFELYDTMGTPYDLTDDVLVTTSGSRFTNMKFSDTTMGGVAATGGVSECKRTDTAYGDVRDYHDAWVKLNPGSPLSSNGSKARSYRLHTTGTDTANPSAQRSTNGMQGFALYATAAGAAPKIYGLGGMQMYTPLSGGTTSEFYLAQVPASHAGKILEVRLWDPGDTGSLTGVLSFLAPGGSGWSATAFSYSSARGSTNSAAKNCTATGTSVMSVTTASGGTSNFNGCWLTISIPIPVGYTAPQDGWWKIRYNMTGSGNSSDVTTWTARIRGNPVHLVLP